MSLESDKQWTPRCKLCIWLNDETDECEGTLSNHSFLQMSPFYKAHPELRPQLFGPGLDKDDCVGMEKRPELEAVVEG